MRKNAFTLVEMLLALLVVSIILSASIPVISSRQKAVAQNINQNTGMPVGGIILWTDMEALPDNTWLECDGSALPTGIEYENARRIFGENLPDLRDLRNKFPDNLIGIWGSNDEIPANWSEATEYRGLFLRGYGSVKHTQNNGSTVGNTETTHTSGDIGVVQGDGVRRILGDLGWGSANLFSYTSGVFEGVNGENVNYVRYGTDWSYSHVKYSHGRYDNARSIPVSNEIRPVNKAVRYIKYTNPTAAYRYIAKVKN